MQRTRCPSGQAAVNCRIFPDMVEVVRDALMEAMADPEVRFSVRGTPNRPVSEMRPDVVAAFARAVHRTIRV